MRKSVPIVAGLACAMLLAGCGHRGYDRARPDEFLVARQAPLVIPPDFSLVPPQPGAARANEPSASQQALGAMFGGPAQRSTGETATLNAAGGDDASDPGIRSGVGDAGTTVVDKGSTTRDIEAAPQGDGQDASVSTPGS